MRIWRRRRPAKPAQAAQQFAPAVGSLQEASSRKPSSSQGCTAAQDVSSVARSRASPYPMVALSPLPAEPPAQFVPSPPASPAPLSSPRPGPEGSDDLKVPSSLASLAKRDSVRVNRKALVSTKRHIGTIMEGNENRAPQIQQLTTHALEARVRWELQREATAAPQTTRRTAKAQHPATPSQSASIPPALRRASAANAAVHARTPGPVQQAGGAASASATAFPVATRPRARSVPTARPSPRAPAAPQHVQLAWLLLAEANVGSDLAV